MSDKDLMNQRDLGSQSYGNAPAPARGQNHLFVVGIDAYQHVRRLRNARRDAEDLVALLTHHYQFEPERVHALYDEAATLGAISRKFRELIQDIPAGDNLLVYFSGHGHYDKTLKEGFLVPVEAQLSYDKQGNPQPEAFFPYSNLQTIVRAAGHLHHLFLIMDSCYSGAVLTQGRNALQRALERDPSRWVLASGRNEVVDDGDGKNSPFAQELLFLLEQHREEGIHSARLIDQLTERVYWNSYQTPIGEPMHRVGHRGGQFVFHPKGGEAQDPEPRKAIQPERVHQQDRDLDPLPDRTPIKASIQQLITRARTEQALNKLTDWVTANEPDLLEDVVLLSGQMANLRRGEMLGILTRNEIDVAYAKLNRGILQLIRELP